MNAIVFGGTGMVGQGGPPRVSARSRFDAAFFCLGATSAGKTEEQYSRVTYDITMAAAKHGAPKRLLESADINKL